MEQLFSKYDLQSSQNNQGKAFRDEVEGFPEDYILSASEEDLVAALAAKATWDPPVLGEPFIASDREISIERRHSDYGESRTYSVKGTQVVIHIPFSGDATFFHVQPEHFHLTPPQAIVKRDFLEVVLEGENLGGDGIRQSVEKLITDLRFHLDQLRKGAEAHNATVADKIRPFIQARKHRILERRQMVSSIGLPMKPRDGAPATYTLPDIRRKPEVKMPVVKEKLFVPEPTLADSEYENVLSIIRSMVRVIENSPHHFADIGEEALRSHFLVQLNGQYRGRATGETFNYKGKTDILIREGDRNVFIAECKVWKGKESLTKTIDQVLGYLHWRDTKAAILLFNRNKDFSNVIAQIAITVQAHPCFKRVINQLGETEWRFVFRNRDDANRELQLAVMAFDIPQPLAVPSAA